MTITFSKNAWEDYVSWLDRDRKITRKINDLLKEIQRNPFEGKGKPEPLKIDPAGLWSRRIDKEHRLIYKVDNEQVIVYTCKYHYDR